VAGQGLPFAARYRGMLLICVGSLVGLLGHFGAVIVRAHRAGLRYRLALAAKDPDVRAVAALSLAPMVGGLLANLGPLVDQLCASTLDPGTITALGYANRITTAFIGIILVSAGTAVLPHLARHAVAGEMAAFKSMLRLYLWVAGLGALALGGLLIGFARPVVRVLFERGQFGPGATDRVVPLLIGLAMGLPFTALSFLLARAFSALGRTHVLMITTGTFVVFNTAFDLVLMRLWGGVGIALATSVSYALNAFILLLMLRVAIGDLHLPTVPPELTRLLSGWRRRRGSTGS
jgi:putative peptidoglycan lipid II flippase